jgi:hypothetical protein
MPGNKRKNRRWKARTVYFFGSHLSWIKSDDPARMRATGCILTAYNYAGNNKILYCVRQMERRISTPKLEFLWCADAGPILEYMDEWLHVNFRLKRGGIIYAQPNVREIARHKMGDLVSKLRISVNDNSPIPHRE